MTTNTELMRQWDEEDAARENAYKAEIDRLTAELERTREQYDSAINQVKDLAAERNKLRAALEGTLTVIDEMMKLAPPSMHRGFQMWRDKIKAALANGQKP